MLLEAGRYVPLSASDAKVGEDPGMAHTKSAIVDHSVEDMAEREDVVERGVGGVEVHRVVAPGTQLRRPPRVWMLSLPQRRLYARER